MSEAFDSLSGKGAICAKCGTVFDGEHGRPVYCHTCHDEIKAKGMTPQLPKAWLEEKPR